MTNEKWIEAIVEILAPLRKGESELPISEGPQGCPPWSKDNVHLCPWQSCPIEEEVADCYTSCWQAYIAAVGLPDWILSYIDGVHNKC